MTVKGYLKTMNGKQVIVYDVNGMELYVDIEQLTVPSYAILMADDLKRAKQVFFESENESWQGVMGENDVGEVLFEMKVLQRCPTDGCKTKRVSTKPPVQSKYYVTARLGTRALAGNDGIEPVVGMGATVGVGSDSDPYTIIEIKTPSHIVIQEDEWRITSGNEGDGSATYEYAPNPSAPREDVTLRRDGYWKLAGGSTIVHVGGRRRYRDPSF